MFTKDQFISYSSPPYKRKLGRAIAIGAAVILLLLLWSVATDYRTRKAAGHHPLPPSSFVLPVAPLMMIGIGLWIGWGQTRIDFRRGLVERRPLGVPWLVKSIRLKDAERLYVGFYRAPTSVTTPNAGNLYTGKLKGIPFWFVRLEGDRARTMLIVQRTYEEAVACAHEIGKRADLKVVIEKEPED